MSISKQIGDLTDRVNFEWKKIGTGPRDEVFMQMCAAESRLTWEALAVLAKAIDDLAAAGGTS